MFNRSITIDCLAAWLCWIGGTLLAFGDMLDFTPDDSGFLGIVAVAFGHLIAVQKAHRQMEHREQVAFDLGKESVRSIR